MVDISHETTEQTERRLLRVIQQARLQVLPGTWTFHEFPLDAFPQAVRADALALVRDDAVWSQLVPSDRAGNELFGVFRFHFPAGADNSGFVGWLATRLKARHGTPTAASLTTGACRPCWRRRSSQKCGPWWTAS